MYLQHASDTPEGGAARSRHKLPGGLLLRFLGGGSALLAAAAVHHGRGIAGPGGAPALDPRQQISHGMLPKGRFAPRLVSQELQQPKHILSRAKTF